MNDESVREPDVVRTNECRTYKGTGMVVLEYVETTRMNGVKDVTYKYHIRKEPMLTDHGEFILDNEQFRALKELMRGIS